MTAFWKQYLIPIIFHLIRSFPLNIQTGLAHHIATKVYSQSHFSLLQGQVRTQGDLTTLLVFKKMKM